MHLQQHSNTQRLSSDPDIYTVKKSNQLILLQPFVRHMLYLVIPLKQNFNCTVIDLNTK